MKNRILLSLIMLLSFDISFCQSDTIRYPPIFSPLKVKPDTLPGIRHEGQAFWGGTEKLMEYLEINLSESLQSKIYPDKTVYIEVNTDTLGFLVDVSIEGGFKSCDICNQNLLDVFKKIYRWQPDCFYLKSLNRFKCISSTHYIQIIFQDNKIRIME